MKKVKWFKVKEGKGKFWIYKEYYSVYGNPTKYAKKIIWIPTKKNKNGKKHTKYYKKI